MLKWTPKSEDDLALIMEHIAENFNVDVAVQAVADIVEYVETTLLSNPLAGKILESSPLFSVLVYKGNSIFYCENPKDKNLYVVYVRPRGMDVKADRINDGQVA